MKKIFILILILCLILTFNVFAEDIVLPQLVLDKMIEENSLIYHIPTSSRVRIPLVPIYLDTTNNRLYPKDGNVIPVAKSDDNGITWIVQDYPYYIDFTSQVILKSTYNVLNQNGDVFFSLPTPVLTQEMGKNQQTLFQTIRPLVLPVMILLVGSVALWKGWRVLKTSLLGA